MKSRLMPTGWQHSQEIALRKKPSGKFTDPVRGLAEMRNGFAFPVVEVIEDTPQGCSVRVSIFTQGNPPSPDEQAALDGTAAELQAGFGT